MDQLTEEEKNIISSVLKRDLEVCSEEIIRIETLKDELEIIKSQGLEDGTNQIIYGALMDTVICVWCKSAFYKAIKFMKKYDHCPYCKKIVCSNCMVEQTDGSVKFLCKYCSKFKELEALSGAWHYANAYNSPELKRQENQNLVTLIGSENVPVTYLETHVQDKIVTMVSMLEPSEVNEECLKDEEVISVSKSIDTFSKQNDNRKGMDKIEDYHIEINEEPVENIVENCQFEDINVMIHDTLKANEIVNKQIESKKKSLNNVESTSISTLSKDNDYNKKLIRNFDDIVHDESSLLNNKAESNPFIDDLVNEASNPFMDDVVKDDLNPIFDNVIKEESNYILDESLKDESSKQTEEAHLKVIDVSRSTKVKNETIKKLKPSRLIKQTKASFKKVRGIRRSTTEFENSQKELLSVNQESFKLKNEHKRLSDKTSDFKYTIDDSASPSKETKRKFFTLRRKHSLDTNLNESQTPTINHSSSKKKYGSTKIVNVENLPISKEYMRINGSIRTIQSSMNKNILEVKLMDATFIQPIPGYKKLKCYVDCKVKTSTFLKQKTEVVKNESSPLWNQILTFKGITWSEESYILLVVKQKTKKKNKEKTYGTVRIGNNMYCSQVEKAVWEKVWCMFKEDRDIWVDFSLPMLKPSDSSFHLRQLSISEEIASEEMASSFGLPSNINQSQMINVSNEPNIDCIGEEFHMHKNVLFQGYLNLSIMYKESECTFFVRILNLKLKNLNILPSLMKNIYVKATYDYHDEVTLITGAADINRSDMMVEWNQDFSIKLDPEKLKNYVLTMDILHRKSDTLSERCGQVALKLDTLIKKCDRFFNQFLNCYFPLHQMTLISPYHRVESEIDLSISFKSENSENGTLSLTVHSAGPKKSLKTRRYLKDSTKIYLQIAMLPCVVSSDIYRSDIMTIENNEFEFTCNWNHELIDLLENKCLEIVVIQLTDDKKIFLAGCRIGTPVPPPFGEEWQDSNPQEHNIWKSLGSDTQQSERTTITLRNSMLSRFIENYEFVNLAPDDLVEEEESVFLNADLKTICVHDPIVELELKYDEDNSVYFHIGTVSNLPSKIDPLCVIVHISGNSKCISNIVPSSDFSSSWNKHLVIKNVVNIQHDSLIFLIGEKYVEPLFKKRSSKKGNSKVNACVDHSRIYGFVFFGKDQSHDKKSKYLSDKANILLNECSKERGKWKSAFVTLSKTYSMEQMKELLDIHATPINSPNEEISSVKDIFINVVTPQDELYRGFVVTSKDTKLVSTIPHEKKNLESIIYFSIPSELSKSSDLHFTKPMEVICDPSYYERRASMTFPEISLVRSKCRAFKRIQSMNVCAKEICTDSSEIQYESQDKIARSKNFKGSLFRKFSLKQTSHSSGNKSSQALNLASDCSRSSTLRRRYLPANIMNNRREKQEESSHSAATILPSCNLSLSIQNNDLVLKISSVDNLGESLSNKSMKLKTYILDSNENKHQKDKSSTFVASNETVDISYIKYISLSKYILEQITIVINLTKSKSKGSVLGSIRLSPKSLDLKDNYSGTHKFLKIVKKFSTQRSSFTRHMERSNNQKQGGVSSNKDTSSSTRTIEKSELKKNILKASKLEECDTVSAEPRSSAQEIGIERSSNVIKFSNKDKADNSEGQKVGVDDNKATCKSSNNANDLEKQKNVFGVVKASSFESDVNNKTDALDNDKISHSDTKETTTEGIVEDAVDRIVHSKADDSLLENKTVETIINESPTQLDETKELDQSSLDTQLVNALSVQQLKAFETSAATTVKEFSAPSNSFKNAGQSSLATIKPDVISLEKSDNEEKVDKATPDTFNIEIKLSSIDPLSTIEPTVMVSPSTDAVNMSSVVQEKAVVEDIVQNVNGSVTESFTRTDNEQPNPVINTIRLYSYDPYCINEDELSRLEEMAILAPEESSKLNTSSDETKFTDTVEVSEHNETNRVKEIFVTGEEDNETECRSVQEASTTSNTFLTDDDFAELSGKRSNKSTVSPSKDTSKLQHSRNVEVCDRLNTLPSIQVTTSEDAVKLLKSSKKLISRTSMGSLSSKTMLPRKMSVKRSLKKKSISTLNLSLFNEADVNIELSYLASEKLVSINILDVLGLRNLSDNEDIRILYVVRLKRDNKEIISWESSESRVNRVSFEAFKYIIELDTLAFCTLKIALYSVLDDNTSYLAENKFTLYTLCKDYFENNLTYSNMKTLKKEKTKEAVPLVEKKEKGFGRITLNLSLEAARDSKKTSFKRNLSKKDQAVSYMLNVELREVNLFEIVPDGQLLFKIKLKSKSKTVSKKKSEIVRCLLESSIIAFFVNFPIKLEDMQAHTLEIIAISAHKSEKKVGSLTLGNTVPSKECRDAWNWLSLNPGKKSEFKLVIHHSKK